MTFERYAVGGDPVHEAIKQVIYTLGAEPAGGVEPATGESAPGDLEAIHLAWSRNGVRVVYDPEGLGSHAATHFEDTPNLRALVEEAIPRIDLSGESMGVDVDMGRDVGVSYMVSTDATDEIVYARRPHRDTTMRFTMSRPPEPSSRVSLVLIRRGEADDAAYDIRSAWVGPITPAYPGTPYETPDSKRFWETHALVWGTQEIEPDSVTTVRPW
jgi:hypothetical protein